MAHTLFSFLLLLEAAAAADAAPTRAAPRPCLGDACTAAAGVAESDAEADVSELLQVRSVTPTPTSVDDEAGPPTGQDDETGKACFEWPTWWKTGKWGLGLSLKRLHPVVAQVLAAARSSTAPWHPQVREFHDWVVGTGLQRMSFTLAINESNLLPCAPKPPMFTTIEELFQIINYVVTTVSPSFTNPDVDGLVGCPLNAFLDWLMWTSSGSSLFRDDQVNGHFNSILGVWKEFLDGPNSREYLTSQAPFGWYSEDAKPWINMSQYVVELPEDSHLYSSWNAFFTRKFKPGMRPVASPEDSKVITSGCESTPLSIVPSGVKAQDRFWLKAQPYSLQEIFTTNNTLAGTDTAELVQTFEGGSVYQAFLSATNYHCWHSPVDGTIEHLYTVPGGIGTYYSELLREGFDNAGPDLSQGYLTSVAVRMVFIIKADDTSLGRVAVVQVGMAEVSSVESLVSQGDKVKKGDLIGQFKFGGSTFINIFQPGVIKEFKVPTGEPVLLNTPIAIAN